LKKSKLIALALAGSITLMGAGYAAWQDSVQIRATVSTGHLNVEMMTTTELDRPRVFNNINKYTEHLENFDFINNKMTKSPYESEIITLKNYFPNIGGSPEYQNPQADDEGDNNDKLVLEFDKFFPGAIVTVPCGMRNKSTMAVELKDVTVTCGTIDSENIFHIDNNLKSIMSIPHLYYRIGNDQTILLPDESNIVHEVGAEITLDQLEGKIEELFQGKKLESASNLIWYTPSKDVVQNMAILFKETNVSGQTNNFYQGKKIRIEIKFKWIQAST
jgi:hypothetical protein